MINGTLVLVSDACRARLFLDRGPRNNLEELQSFACPGGREHVRDRVSDRSGLKPAGGQGVRAGASQEVDPKEAEARAFARFLADTLKKKHNEQAFKELVLAAPPHFLGLLRSALDETLSKCVSTSFDKDYTTLDAQELSKRIHVGVR
jgi:protein required for attachment to host cells